VKTVVGELILNVSDSSMLLNHVSILMKLRWKLVIVALWTGMSWACCSVCFLASFSQVMWKRVEIVIVTSVWLLLNFSCSSTKVKNVTALHYCDFLRQEAIAHLWRLNALEERCPQPLLQLSVVFCSQHKVSCERGLINGFVPYEATEQRPRM
jgi:hypothetical protein